VLCVQGGRVSLYECPDEDGVPHGGCLASADAASLPALADGVEFQIGAILIFVTAPVQQQQQQQQQRAAAASVARPALALQRAPVARPAANAPFRAPAFVAPRPAQQQAPPAAAPPAAFPAAASRPAPRHEAPAHARPPAPASPPRPFMLPGPAAAFVRPAAPLPPRADAAPLWEQRTAPPHAAVAPRAGAHAAAAAASASASLGPGPFAAPNAPPLSSNAALLAQFDDWDDDEEEEEKGGQGDAGAAGVDMPSEAAQEQRAPAPPPSHAQHAPRDAACAVQPLRRAPLLPFAPPPPPPQQQQQQQQQQLALQRVPPPPAAAASAFRPPAVIPGGASTSAAPHSRAVPPTRGVGGASVSCLRFAPQPPFPARMAPPAFRDGAQYCDAVSAAVLDALQAQVCEVARNFAQAIAGAPPQGCDPVRVRAAAREQQLSYYAHAQLCMWAGTSSSDGAHASGSGAKRGRDGPLSPTRADGGGGGADATFMLKLGDARERETSSHYAKGDLWVLSTSPRLDAHGGDGACFTLFAFSTYHGPTPDGGKLGLAPLGPRPSLSAAQRRGVDVHALRIGSFAGEQEQLNAMAALAAEGSKAMPLLPALLRGPGAGAGTGGVLATLAHAADEALMARYKLNADQAAVLTEVDAAVASGAPRVVLVQGPFGCGKTHTLAALVRHLCDTLAARGDASRILLAGFTNASVDGLLCALLDGGFDAFVRVGALRRIALRVLPFSLGTRPGGDAAKAADEEKELRVLRDAATGATRAALEAELAARAAGSAAARTRRLAKSRVVAVTTASCTQERLAGARFDIVIIDEATQLTEAAALHPCARFGARCAVLVGDPCQLPPLLPNCDAATAAALGRPMFTRLQAAGHAARLLRTQYRCHPALSAMPNALFYGGRLLDGVTPQDRPPLLPSLPHQLFLDVPPDCDARLVARLVRCLTSAGVGEDDVAVVCFYRAHVKHIRRALGVGEEEHASGGVMCSTVDAFQGQEKGVIIVFCAGVKPAFAMAERLNVAVTRARTHLLFVGCSHGAMHAQPWLNMVLLHARRTPKSYVRYDEQRGFPDFAAPMLAPTAADADAAADAGGAAPAASASADALATDDDDDDDDAAMLLDADTRELPAVSDSSGGGGGSGGSLRREAAIAISDDADSESDDDAIDLTGASPAAAAAAPDDAAPFVCSPEAEAAFARVAFSGADLWDGYKAFHVIAYAKPHAARQRAAFYATKLGAYACVLACLRPCVAHADMPSLHPSRRGCAGAVPCEQRSRAAAPLHRHVRAGGGVRGGALRRRRRVRAPLRAASGA
jgi:hypothetical protein